MTAVAQWQPAGLRHARAGNGNVPAKPSRQFVSFTFYALDPAWLRLDAAARLAGAQELAGVIEGCRGSLLVHSYTTFGLRAETDFLLWRIAADLDDFEAMAVAMRRTPLGRCLHTPYSYLAMTRPDAPAGDAASGGNGGNGATVVQGDKYLLVCPLVQTRAWHALPKEERQDMTRDLIRLGHEAPGAKRRMTYSSGLDVQDCVLTFETDRPEDFPDLVQGLRGTEAGLYAQRDTPIFTCTRQDVATILARISGV